MQHFASICLGIGVWVGSEWILTGATATAQVASDGSLGTLVNGSTTDACLLAECTITGGILTTSGSSLLHSFEQLSLSGSGLNQSVLFIDPGVSDIIVRVTGGAESLLNGVLQTSVGSTANLLLVNPSGVSFGPNARLDIGGAFTASTASDILFDDNVWLAAGESTAASETLLRVSAPIGLGFLDRASAPVTVQGSGNFLTFGSPSSPNSLFVNRIFQQSPSPGAPPGPLLPPLSELAVGPGQSLALIANGINLEGGNLTALGGQIELGSVDSGVVNVADVSQGSNSGSYDYSEVEAFADISLLGRSTLEVSSGSPGRVLLRGDNINLSESSAVLAETLAETLPVLQPAPSPAQGGLIDIFAVGTVQVSDFVEPPNPPTGPAFHTYISVDVAPGATGPGGEIKVQSNSLTVDNGAQLGASTFGGGAAGVLELTVNETLSLDGIGVGVSSGLFAVADALSVADAGAINVQAGQFLARGGAGVNTNSSSPGTSGSITVNADRVSLLGTSEPVTIPTLAGPQTSVIPTLVESAIIGTPGRQGGDVTVTANEVLVTDGAKLITSTFGPGDAGNLEIVAGDITVSGVAPFLNAGLNAGPSSLSTAVFPGASGSGGDLTIRSDRLSVLDGAQISTGTTGPGQAGDLFVNSDAVVVSGQSSQGRSGLFATAILDRGAGGNLEVRADTLEVRAGATLSVSNFPSSPNNPFPPGQGAVGNLEVSAQAINLNDGTLSADSAAGDFGNIRLQTDVLTLRDRARITTNATNTATGGNISIAATDFVVAIPDENSDITANAVFGDGGNVNITAQAVLGIEARPRLTDQSDITASSDFGVEGVVRLDVVSSEVRSEAEPLPESASVPEVVSGCSPGGSSTSRFVQSGQGGIRTNPYGVVEDRNSLGDISIPRNLTAGMSAEANATTDI
ncbi:MAG: filamentous hemagglutinin N-terminal domain-containing protein, partial [Cyanobacteria bacterium J06607_17]